MKHSARPWMVYGANGYTGGLLVAEAVRRGEAPIVAGRNAAAVARVAAEHGLPHRVFALDDPAVTRAALADVALVLNAAGPMVATAGPLAGACVAAGAHYVDVTAEVDALHQIAALDGAARDAGVTLLPAAGYDVVPSDCLAAHVVAGVPEARRLEIGIWSLPQPSRGTLRTVADMLRRGGWRRRGGRLERYRVGRGARRLTFPPGRRWALPVPWGDLVTAHRSTGVPDITVYLALKPADFALGLLAGPVGPWLFRARWATRLFERLLSKGVAGPPLDVRTTGRGWFWARATGAGGEQRSAFVETPEGYRFTELAAVEVATRVLAGQAPHGMTTPAKAFGADFVVGVPGCRWVEAPAADRRPARRAGPAIAPR